MSHYQRCEHVTEYCHLTTSITSIILMKSRKMAAIDSKLGCQFGRTL